MKDELALKIKLCIINLIQSCALRMRGWKYDKAMKFAPWQDPDSKRWYAQIYAVAIMLKRARVERDDE
jgi:hypothetical protein